MTASNEMFSRTEQLIGKDCLEKLKNARVAVFGVGGVGSYVVEALVRSGVGKLDLIDNDVVAESNLNRQIVALHSTLGMPKVEVAAKRAKDINPAIEVTTHQCFYLPEEAQKFPFCEYDYIVDAIDTVKAKISLVEEAKKAGTPIICSMGTGNKLDPTRFEIADISKTTVCPLAKVMRIELRKRGISHVKVLYSKEEPVNIGSRTPASIAFVPSVAGLVIAGEVIKDLISQ